MDPVPPVRDIFDCIDAIVKVIGVVGGVLGGGLALCQFRQNARLKRTEWLHQLYKAFYEGDSYTRVRRILDYRQDPEYGKLRDALSPSGADVDLAEDAVKYLNFFEFVASLEKLDQLKQSEIGILFNYYLRNLKEHPFVMEFIQKEDFENLASFLAKVSKGS